jgi:RNA polymerase sigma factor (sigma-70 family)
MASAVFAQRSRPHPVACLSARYLPRSWAIRPMETTLSFRLRLSMSYHSAAIAAALKSATAPLTAERERELCIRWRDQRDARARDLVTRSQLPYIVRRATTLAKRSQLDVDELFACGCEGLAQALARFDPDHGVRVITYAWKWINQAMHDAIAFHGSIFGSRTNKRATQWIHRLHGTARRIFASEDPERETLEFIRTTPHERLRKMHPRAGAARAPACVLRPGDQHG